MSVDKDFLLNALLKHNFLPTQKREKEEIPQIITSGAFTECVARRLADCKEARADHPGYDTVEYRLTRFNGVARVCSIPHPKAYATLALSIAENWEQLKYISENTVSKIVPRKHEDGRIIVMEYENLPKAHQALEYSFGRHFMVRTDISNFFPSIYSHSIPWATVGNAKAKKAIGKNSKWYNSLDRAIRMTKRSETGGIAIGPATSNIIAESILARVDCKLGDEYTYTRYIDDYTAYCESHERAQGFVLSLAEELSKYKLALNIGKTEFIPLPQATGENWIVDLKNALLDRGDLSPEGAINYLDFALRLSRQTPDGSVLKYSLKALLSTVLDSRFDVDGEVVDIVLHYALNLSFHQPVLLPLLERLFDEALSVGGDFRHKDELQALLCEHVRLRHSDAISWILYFSVKYGVPIRDCCACRIVELQDCIPMLLLSQSGDESHENRVIEFARGLEKSNLYGLDQQWLLLYELVFDERMENPYRKKDSCETTFDIMKSEGVRFIRPPTVT